MIENFRTSLIKKDKESFLDGSYRSNRDKESWQLVRTKKGWKIAAVLWSQEINPVPPKK